MMSRGLGNFTRHLLDRDLVADVDVFPGCVEHLYNPGGILDGKRIRWQDGFEAFSTLLKYRIAPLESFDRRSIKRRRDEAAVES